MLLGVLLALAAGVIVIFVVSQYTSAPSANTKVVVARRDLPPATTLAVSPTGAGQIAIAEAFEVRTVNSDFAPQDAMPFTTQDALNAALNNQVVIGAFYAGDILRAKDPRLALAGTKAVGSLSSVNPAAFSKPGSVLSSIDLATKSPFVAGDTVDVLVTMCNLPDAKDPGACETQTTLQNVFVYASQDTTVWLVLDHQQSLELKFLAESGKVNLVLRKPNDTNNVSTDPVTPSYIVKRFNY